jgi:hypothetical protein
MSRRRRFHHHVRLRLALNLEFQEDGRASSRTVFITDHVVELGNLVAALITGLLIWLGATLGGWRLRRRAWAVIWWSWSQDLALSLRAAAQLLAGDWRKLRGGWSEDLAIIGQAVRLMFVGSQAGEQLVKVV